MRAILLATTGALALSTAAWAASDNSANSNGQNNPKVRQELTQMLQKSGFTDIRVAPHRSWSAPRTTMEIQS